MTSILPLVASQTSVNPALFTLTILVPSGLSRRPPPIRFGSAGSSKIVLPDAISAIANNVKKDAAGNITEVDLRETAAGNEVLTHLAGLPKLQQ